ncbi:hypothetical protein ACQKOF_02005 [Lysinibacillus sp. NPDC093190]
MNGVSIPALLKSIFIFVIAYSTNFNFKKVSRKKLNNKLYFLSDV